MYSRIIPRELHRNEGFLGLPSDTHRLVYVVLWDIADDFGNLGGNAPDLLRLTRGLSQVQSEEQLAKIIADLSAVGLARLYDSAGSRYLHICHFRNRRTYIKRRTPLSPWCDPTAPTGPYKAGARRRYQSDDCGAGATRPDSARANSANTQPDSDLMSGECSDWISANLTGWSPNATRLPKDWTLPNAWRHWAVNYSQGSGQLITHGTALRIADGFRDYWHSVPGPMGRRVDWMAAWRSWVRRAHPGRALPQGNVQAEPDIARASV